MSFLVVCAGPQGPQGPQGMFRSGCLYRSSCLLLYSFLVVCAGPKGPQGPQGMFRSVVTQGAILSTLSRSIPQALKGLIRPLRAL